MDKIPGASPRNNRRKVARRVKSHMNELTSPKNLQPSSQNPSSSNTFSINNNGSISSDSDYSKESVNSSSENEFIFSDVITSSDDSESDSDPSIHYFKSELASWIMKYNVATTAISDLLKLLRKFKAFKLLPKDGRTVLKTSSNVEIRNLDNGQYCDFGLQ